MFNIDRQRQISTMVSYSPYCYLSFNNRDKFSYRNLLIFIAVNLALSSGSISIANAKYNNLGRDGIVTRTHLDLTCFSCTASHSNNTCTELFRKTTMKSGADYRCRIYERNGMVVAQGIVPAMLCTPEAMSRVNGKMTNTYS